MKKYIKASKVSATYNAVQIAREAFGKYYQDDTKIYKQSRGYAIKRYSTYKNYAEGALNKMLAAAKKLNIDVIDSKLTTGFRDGSKFYHIAVVIVPAYVPETDAEPSAITSSMQSSDITQARKDYVYRCLEDGPEIPEQDVDEYPEAWSAYYRDEAEYKTWCFVDAIEDGLFTDDERDEFDRLWDTCIADLAAPWS